ncbi:RNA polymerase sigma factor [Desulfoscipio gibsoniae]|uniref:RNA polymerase sigma factor, sigma-70 family n=1 Tax=Desulfoscipio gibsoniae DSM 7213 TaxID=767817 RepID=R4KPQ0_9FIRM|nr:sigma-70 family RNA polymerase sigma factor [Desulfoscipio gibsoniae]AGL02540.1 RNA polymerase sigma factor, sigma-70 family [Desulfoscipio gibsoniae DSM 7213]
MDELLQRCKEKDKEAWGLLFEKYHRQIYQTALIFAGNRTLAEDITQEAFIRAVTKINLFNPCYSFEAWLYRIVVNVSRNMIRSHKWTSLFQSFRKGSLNARDAYDPFAVLEEDEQKKILRAIINELPYKVREVIVLRYFNGFAQDEVAAILEIPVGTVKSRINTGLNKMRQKIKMHSSIGEVLKL